MNSKIKNQTKKPLIGITMHYDHFDEVKKGVRYRYIREEYGQAITRMGGEAIFLDSSVDAKRAARMCDGFVISGGEDINSSLYGEEQLGETWVEPIERSNWERQLIDACDKLSKPILGICYGHQLLNVHYGGNLYQDIPSQCGVSSHGASSTTIEESVSFAVNTLGFKAGDNYLVGHRHHQAVKDLGRGMKAVAVASDGTIESIAGNGHVGIQWHPEADSSADLVYGPFVESCRQRANKVTIGDILRYGRSVRLGRN